MSVEQFGVDIQALSDTAGCSQSTAVLMYKPQSSDKVLTCSLGSLEVFSCCLMAEEDTALSIIDPMTISIELNANPLPELKPTTASTAVGLLAVPETQLRQLLLEVRGVVAAVCWVVRGCYSCMLGGERGCYCCMLGGEGLLQLYAGW